MNRRQSREVAFKIIFAASFDAQGVREAADAFIYAGEAEPDSFCELLTSKYDENTEFVDTKIKENLRGWSFERVSRISVSVLRLAVTEMYFGDGNPDSVIINEAVEIAKTYGDESDFQFVNGLLSSVLKSKVTT